MEQQCLSAIKVKEMVVPTCTYLFTSQGIMAHCSTFSKHALRLGHGLACRCVPRVVDVNTAFEVGSRPRPHDSTNHESSVKAGRHAFVITTKTSPARRRDKAGLDSFSQTGDTHGQEHLIRPHGDLEGNAVQNTLDDGSFSMDLAATGAYLCSHLLNHACK